MANNSKIEFDMASVEAVARNMEIYGEEFKVACKVVTNTVGHLCKNYAQTNARWKDRTGNARQGLFFSSKVTDKEITIILAHRMEYGFWLELAHQRRYKILEEALEKHVAEFLDALKELI